MCTCIFASRVFLIRKPPPPAPAPRPAAASLSKKRRIDMPETLTNVIFCKNPRCISSCERELMHVFKLTDRKNKV